MYTDREEFEGWMERIMERFDRTEKLLERVLKKNNTLDGEEVLDNQDLCLLLKVGIRTLQRYRAIGVLPYFTISGSPESGKAQEKGAVPVRMTFF